MYSMSFKIHSPVRKIEKAISVQNGSLRSPIIFLMKHTVLLTSDKELARRRGSNRTKSAGFYLPQLSRLVVCLIVPSTTLGSSCIQRSSVSVFNV